MKTHFVLTMTALNLVLAGWMLRCQPVPQVSPLTAELPPQPAAAFATATHMPQPATALAPPTNSTAPAFHWSEIESPDYRTYIRNLRAIGCPEATIRDLITADLHALYQERRAQARCPEPTEFWRCEFGLEILSQTNLARLDAEEQAVLTALLGREASDATTTAQATSLVSGMRLCAQLEPKRAALEEWSQRFHSAKSELLAITNQRDLTDAELAQLRTLEAEQEQALIALLTPDELAEFDVRNSASAQCLRLALLGLEVSELEFRTLLTARQDLEARLASAATDEDHVSAQQAYQEFVANLLDAERYARFERAQNPEFQEFFTQGIANGLDAKAIEAQWAETQSQLASNLAEP